jgi:4,5-DOPA dioxygenase extradiol
MRIPEAWAAVECRRSAKPKAILCDFRTLVHSRHRGDGDARSADDPRLRRLSRGAARVSTIPRRATRAVAARVQSLLAPVDVRMDDEWGLDHGTWAVLCHVYPQADVPVVQLAIDGTNPPRFHYELGQRLAVFARRRHHAPGQRQHRAQPSRHAQDQWRRRVSVGPSNSTGRCANSFRATSTRRSSTITCSESPPRWSVPTPEHYLPMLYVAGARRDDDAFTVITDGIDLASVSMLSFAYGNA